METTVNVVRTLGHHLPSAAGLAIEKRTPVLLQRLRIFMRRKFWITALLAVFSTSMVIPTMHCQVVVGQDFRGSTNRRTPEVIALERARDSVVNLRGKKTITEATPASFTPQVKSVNGMGTGVVIDPRGYILTNYHVIDGIQNLVVNSGDYATTGTLVSYDHETDLAIIKVETDKPMPVIPIGTSSDLMPAETVLAVGNAYGYTDTCSKGIISHLRRQVPVSDTQIYYDLIQTDASINPGNSGGPLINLDGQMIGINVAVRVGAQGIGFAIPVNKAMDVAADLFSKQITQRVRHGMILETTYPNHHPITKIISVEANSPAAKAGLKSGDQISRLDGVAIKRQLDFQTALLDCQVGQILQVQVQRDGETIDASLSLEEGRYSSVQLVWDTLGMELKPEVAANVRKLNEKYAGGLRVERVKPNSAAKQQGIQPGDILVGLHEWETLDMDDVNYVLRQPDVQHKAIQFYILRNRQAYFGKLQMGAMAVTASLN